MKNVFHVRIRSFSNLLEIEGARTSVGFAALLDAMEYGDRSGMGDDELRETCIMALQDLEPAEAAFLVLKHDMGEVLRDGQIRNMANEMLDDKLWEEYADTSLHERLFIAGSLLYAAFPKYFPEPDAARVVLEITISSAAAKELLIPSPNESLLVRLLADGMDRHSVLHRLFGEQIAGTSFPNADEVIWRVRTEALDDDVIGIEVIGSGYWLDALNRTKFYESTAYADQIRTPVR